MNYRARMTSRRHREPGPAPQPGDFQDVDAWRAKAFGYWLRSHQITVDGFSGVSKLVAPPGVSRSAVISLSGAAGGAVTSRWSSIRRGVLLSLWETINQVQPMSLAALREMLMIAPDHDPDTWAEPAAVAGEGRTPDLRVNAVLTCVWDVADHRPPHVYLTRDGRYLISDSAQPQLLRLGRLRSVVPG